MAAFVSGASRGIGLAIVERLLTTTPAPVVAAGRSALESPGLQALAGQHPGRLTSLALDLRDPASIAAAAGAAGDRVGLLVHCAGTMHPSGRGENSVTRLEHDAMLDVMSTNVMGPALLTKALYPTLRRPSDEAPSKVVAVGAGVASIGTNGAGGWYSYRMSKTAMNAFMKNLSIEGRRHNVLAFTLYPQMVESALSKPYVKGNPYPELRTPEEVAERMMELVDAFGVEDTGRFVNMWSRDDIPW